MKKEYFVASPVDQFKLKTLVPFEVGGVDLAYTTSSLWMTITVVAVTLFLTPVSYTHLTLPTNSNV